MNPGETLHAKREMAGVTGLEPAASAVTGQRSNQLSYTPISKLALSHAMWGVRCKTFRRSEVKLK